MKSENLERALQKALAKAWDEGHRAGEMWDYTQHTAPEFGPDANPYAEKS